MTNLSSDSALLILTINEPWNVHYSLRGRILRPIESVEEGKEYYLFRVENGDWFLIIPRYKGDHMEDIDLGQQIPVAVAAVTDPEMIHNDHFRLDQVNYFGIGVVGRYDK